MRNVRWLIVAMLLSAGSATANDTSRVKVADFSSLQPGDALPAEWESASVARIARHTRYTLIAAHGSTALQAEADASMSSLVRNIDIDAQALPWLHWRWRISALNGKSDLHTKQGDDFPVRIYVFFDYDLMQLSFFERTKIRIARALYGDKLPLAALCYVWARNDPPGTTAWNAYTDRVRMVVASSGADQVGQWVAVERNVSDDYREAFGEPVPRITGIAIATDSDDTGERSLAWYGDIAFANRPQQQP